MEKPDVFVAAARVSLEAVPVQIIGTPQPRVLCLSGFIPADEDAVMMYRILIQQPAIQKLPDHLWLRCLAYGDRRRPCGHPHCGAAGKDFCISALIGLSACGLGESLACPWKASRYSTASGKDFPQNCCRKVDGIPAGILRVPEPGTPVLDPQAVHLRGSMEAVPRASPDSRGGRAAPAGPFLWRVCISVSVKRFLIFACHNAVPPFC